MIIKPLTTDDSPLMSAIHHSFPYPWERPWSSREYQQLLSLPSVIGFCGRINDDLCGFALFQYAAENADLLFIAVKESYQRQNIGKEILHYGEEVLKNLNVDNITLEVCAKNEQAVDFYSKNSYFKISLRKDYYNNKSIAFDALIMKKNLRVRQ